MKFEPSKKKTILVPYLEDANKDTAPYYSTTRDPEEAQMEVMRWFNKLGAKGVFFEEGTFTDERSKLKREGYTVTFSLNGFLGEMRIIGLPVRHVNEKKLNTARSQALLNFADGLKSAFTSAIFTNREPSDVLIPALKMGEQTVSEMMNKKMLELTAPKSDEESLPKVELIK